MHRIFTGLMLLAAMGCTTDGLIRTEIVVAPSEISAEPHPHLPLSIERYPDFRLGVIELNDAGEPRSLTQEKAVLSEIDELGSKGSLTLVTFVHGWHHGAEVDDANVVAFRDVLRKLSAPDSGVRGPIMGVYLAWRGEPFKGRWAKNWVSNLSFWNREAKAHHIGARGGEMVLRELNARISTLRREGKTVTMVTVGHSFGALLVLTAVAAEMIDYEHCLDKPFCWPPMRKDPGRAFGDLVVLINPAVEAERFVPFDIYSRQVR
ncbi:MAG: hypothetical protein QOE82_187, partial [Thermoanaerobaculia bacterium]|nr:hypothetical protein [Thermoanaerobaculia bacterium]